MGFKKLKDHYRIEHQVTVREKGICIGSPYIPDIIIIGLDGTIKKRYTERRGNNHLLRYQYEMDADPNKLREVVLAKDEFKNSIPVYTYEGGTIIEKRCEAPGWPNVTHDGDMMYENTYSTDKAKIVKRAKENARIALKFERRNHDEAKANLARIEKNIATYQSHIRKLDSDFPDINPEKPEE
jgi:hypothetical protein